MFLYQELKTLRKYGNIFEAPEYIFQNLNPAFELRKYQVQAFENFIKYFENKEKTRPLQVLFHMATGSGKTLIMAGLIIYLYKQGYRNFLFFVNLTNIIDKTRENFLNSISAKYLFAEEIIIDGEKIRINAVENFQDADENAINICFETTQGLHTKIFFARENDISLSDFENKKIVLISDEAHHLNVDTRNAGKKIEDNSYTWEKTIKNIFNQNAENILLEFTATCDIANAAIRSAYEDKIIFDYPLQKFYNDKFSKDIITLRSDFPIMERALQAIILSQYRLKVFQDNRLSIKPIILFKAAKIADSKKFLADFLDALKNLDGENLREFAGKCKNEIMIRAFKYFEDKGISFEMLAAELKEDFSEKHCISVNDDEDAEKKQLLLNSLESLNNPYRAIFEVKKLDEGWDVLNLFDIVRLYETRQSGGKKISAVTISEAQLIGRGARYCPFKLDDEQPKFQRKFDSDVTNELRVCETLYYHCQNDSRYIKELKDALREIGLDLDKVTVCHYRLKESFKQDNLYKCGIIFLNERRRSDKNSAPNKISPEILEKIYSYRASAGISGLNKMMTDEDTAEDVEVKIYTVRLTIKEIAAINYALINKALIKFPNYRFSDLKKIFTDLKSTKIFITDENYLGGVKIDIKSPFEKPPAKILYDAVLKVLGEIAAEIQNSEKKYEGSKIFYPKEIKKIFTDKTVHYSETYGGGLGLSQNDSSIDADLKIDLSKKDWFAHNDNFGTSEEKAFVAYFSEKIDALRKIYSKIFLIRNERQFCIYSFEDGARFEPDYILLLQKNDGENFEQWQIFIEPKGEHLEAKDAWKEKFLLQLKENAAIAKEILKDDKYNIWGFHFFNRENKEKIDADFKTLTD